MKSHSLFLVGLLASLSLPCQVPFLPSRAYAQAASNADNSSSGQLSAPPSGSDLKPPAADQETLPNQVQKAIAFKDSLTSAQLEQIQSIVASHQPEINAFSKQFADLNSQSQQTASSSKLESVRVATQNFVAVQNSLDQEVASLLTTKEQLDLFNSSKPTQPPAAKSIATANSQTKSFTSNNSSSVLYATLGAYYAYYQYLYSYYAYTYCSSSNASRSAAYTYASYAYNTYGEPGLEKAAATYFNETYLGSDFGSNSYTAYTDLYNAYYYSNLAYQSAVADYSATKCSYSYNAAYTYGSTAYTYLSSAYSYAYSAYLNR